MKKLITHWKLVAALLVVFVSGILCGSLGTLGVLKKKMAQAQNSESLSELWMRRLETKLHLNETQSAEIGALVRSASGEIQQKRRRSFQDIQETLNTTDAGILAKLTPEQQKKYEDLKTQRTQRFKRFLDR